jgi:hypothetical protein
MTTTISRRRINEGVARAAALCLLALAAVLLHSREARAQWTTSGANTTTTTNVGIGTASSNLTGYTEARTLTVSRGTSSTSQGVIELQGGNGTDSTNHMGGVNWFNGANRNAYVGAASDGAVNSGNIQFYTSNAGAIAERMRIDKNGNVGIGTSNPAYHLHVSNNLNSEVFETVENINAGATAAASIIAKTNNGYAYLKMGSTAYGSWAAVGTTGTGSFYYDVFNGSGDHVWRTTASAVERMRVTSAGNVGIGTAAPVSKLHVAGDITVDGNISAKYQDVAEWVPTTQKLSAGTVVVLDKRSANHVAASTVAYDTRVAGVVSAQPGIALGERGEGKALVATTGRVKVKVDATRAPIEIGDLIVTSDVEGVAMKSVPFQIGGRQIHAPGTIIGKALEPLEKGAGEILVLLSLQ